MTSVSEALMVVAQSVPWAVGDIVITFPHESNEIMRMLETLKGRYGIDVRTVTCPYNTDEAISRMRSVIEEIQREGNRRIVMAAFSHVNPKTGRVTPLKRLVSVFTSFGISTCVDGSDALGNFLVNLGTTEASYYVARLNVFVPTHPNIAILVTQPLKHPAVNPSTVSYFHGQGYAKEFSYTGLTDRSKLFSLCASIDFVEKKLRNWKGVMQYAHQLCSEAVGVLRSAWGVDRSVNDVETHPQSILIIPLPFSEIPVGYEAEEVATNVKRYMQEKLMDMEILVNQRGNALWLKLYFRPLNDIQEIHMIAEAINEIAGKYHLICT
eukprot:PhF_6_TR15949/c0_g3_i2/m.24814